MLRFFPDYSIVVDYGFLDIDIDDRNQGLKVFLRLVVYVVR